jgi:hypothetical protein
MKAKYKIGDKVDFVNDFGVLFTNYTVTKIDYLENEIRYFIDCDSYWVSKKEKNLHLAGTYKPKSFDIELKNGLIAKFAGFDDWGNKLFSFSYRERDFTVVYHENEKCLYSIVGDYQEPCSPLKEVFQPKGIV